MISFLGASKGHFLSDMTMSYLTESSQEQDTVKMRILFSWKLQRTVCWNKQKTQFILDIMFLAIRASCSLAVRAQGVWGAFAPPKEAARKQKPIANERLQEHEHRNSNQACGNQPKRCMYHQSSRCAVRNGLITLSQTLITANRKQPAPLPRL